MNGYNKEMAKRVWQRVQSAQPQPPVVPQDHTDELLQLIAEEWQTGACYRQLASHLSGQQAAVAKNLHSQKQSQVACLKGLYILLAGKAPNVPAQAPVSEPVNVLLRRCYGCQMRCLARYEAKIGDPEYGPVYSQLAEQNKNHCHSILTLLGNGSVGSAR